MATAKISNIIVETLASIGVKRIYGVPGDSLNGITDAIRAHDSVEWIHTRNEEAAAFAAGAGRETHTSSTDFSIATATAYLCWRSPLRYPA